MSTKTVGIMLAVSVIVLAASLSMAQQEPTPSARWGATVKPGRKILRFDPKTICPDCQGVDVPVDSPYFGIIKGFESSIDTANRHKAQLETHLRTTRDKLWMVVSKVAADRGTSYRERSGLSDMQQITARFDYLCRTTGAKC